MTNPDILNALLRRCGSPRSTIDFTGPIPYYLTITPLVQTDTTGACPHRPESNFRSINTGTSIEYKRSTPSDASRSFVAEQILVWGRFQ